MIYGWAGLVDGLVERMRREMDGDVKVVGTGGLVGQMREVVPVPAVRECRPQARGSAHALGAGPPGRGMSRVNPG